MSEFTDYRRERPVAVFRCQPALLLLNTLVRMVPAALVLLLGYAALSLLVSSIRTDPADLFRWYWPYVILLCIILAAVWTLWFDLVRIEAYKDHLEYHKRKKKWVIRYDTIIAFSLFRNFLIIIPMPAEKSIIAARTGKTNLVRKCSCLSKQDFYHLHHICNTGRPAGYEIRMERTNHIGV